MIAIEDAELIELAAKAVGLPECGWMGSAFMYVKDNILTDWDPIADDGDALRLAVKLKLIVTFADGGAGLHVLAGQRLGPFSSEPLPIVYFLDQPEVDLKATRRAIVRAAAELGKS